MYKPFRPFTLLRGLTITIVIIHLRSGMILQVVNSMGMLRKIGRYRFLYMYIYGDLSAIDILDEEKHPAIRP